MELEVAFKNMLIACHSINFNLNSLEQGAALRQSIEVVAKALEQKVDQKEEAKEEVNQ